MALHFIGTHGELQAWLASEDVFGSWQLLPNHVYMLRCRDGANVHWAQGSKSLWFSGKLKARERLACKLELALMRRIRADFSSLLADNDR